LGRFEDNSLRDEDQELIRQVQGERHLVYTENRFTNDIAAESDSYRLRLPCEVKTYELTGVVPSGEFYFTLNELRNTNIASAVSDIGYHVTPNRTTPQKRLVEQVRMLYFSENLTTPLPFGQLNALGLPYETYKLALTDDLLTAVLGEQLNTEARSHLVTANLSGYLSGADLADRFPGEPTRGQYWIRSGIAGFADDAADHFYLPERYTDPFGNTTTLVYDRRDLYIQSSTDPVGNTTTVEVFDFRVLAPRRLRDINGNVSEVMFDVLGMLAAMAVLGKGSQGDNLLGFDEALLHPDLATLIRFFTEEYNEAEARRLLGNATARHLYYFGEQQEADGTMTYNHHPACAAGLVREVHVAEGGADSPLQAGFEYSDGMGAVLVKKVQAEPEADGQPLRWIATGKTVLNNKGKPVKQYEPYFSPSGHRFEEPMEVGVTLILFYDAAGRQVRTEMPDRTYNRVEFSPWFMATWDGSDTILEPGNTWYARRTDPDHPDFAQFNTPENRRAVRLAEIHANTPAVTHLDSLGRDVVAIAHNRFEHEGAITDEKYVTYTKLDAEGKPLWIEDARGNRVMEYITPAGAERLFTPCYDIAGNLLAQHSMDGGDRWMVADATGQPFYAWDRNERVDEGGILVPENRVFHTTYDALRRPLEQRLRINGGETLVVERLVYGESHPEAQARNLRGQLWQHFDPSGLETNERFDFKGNRLEASRRLTQTYNEPVIDWNTETPLDERFTQRTRYDALGRMTRLENWHRSARPDQPAPPPPATYTPQYNQRGVLAGEILAVQGQVTEAILNIDHDAKGQRLRVDYGNNTSTSYTYDPETFRLTRLTTTRTGGSRVYQDLHYTYDPVGNITEIRDDAYEPIFFSNQRVEPRSRFGYDALYRLIEAEGREQYSNSGAPPQKLPNAPEVTFPVDSPIDPNALRNYTHHYVYDAVGNITRMEHQAGDSGSWTRHYDYAIDSNRLLRTWLGSRELEAVRYDYDTHGSLLNLANTPEDYRLRWDYRDMIHTANLGGGGQAFYTYDSGKQRTRKRIEHLGSRVEERLYLGGMELYRRWQNGALVEEIETHHLFADDQRALIVEDVLSTNNPRLTPGILFRYQYGNHLGSVSLEMTGGNDPQVISYEEYHPYGTTAYQARNRDVQATAKRYRYTGMERDEEPGLSYHTARYYLPWLGRWGSVDPIGVRDTLNAYSYARNNPFSNTDMGGTQAMSWLERRTQQMSQDYQLIREYLSGAERSVGSFVQGIGNALRHPVDTAETMVRDIDDRLEAGDARGALNIIVPIDSALSEAQHTREAIDRGDLEAAGEHATNTIITGAMVIPVAGTALRVLSRTARGTLRTATRAMVAIPARRAVAAEAAAVEAAMAEAAMAEAAAAEAAAAEAAAAEAVGTAGAPTNILFGEIKPLSAAGIRGGRRQLHSRIREAAVTEGGNAALVLYSRSTRVVTMITYEILEDGFLGEATWLGEIGRISEPLMETLRTEAGGRLDLIGNWLEPTLRQMASEATGIEFAIKASSENGADLVRLH
jgi:RHS repeat-associated protein